MRFNIGASFDLTPHKVMSALLKLQVAVPEQRCAMGVSGTVPKTHLHQPKVTGSPLSLYCLEASIRTSSAGTL